MKGNLHSAALMFCLPCGVWAQPLVAEQAFVPEAETRQSAPLHLTLANPTSASVVIVAARAAPSAHIALRHHTQRAGQNVIESGGTITIPAKSVVKLLPGATEVVMLNLQTPLVAGREFPLTLVFANGASQSVRVAVREKKGGL